MSQYWTRTKIKCSILGRAIGMVRTVWCGSRRFHPQTWPIRLPVAMLWRPRQLLTENAYYLGALVPVNWWSDPRELRAHIRHILHLDFDIGNHNTLLGDSSRRLTLFGSETYWGWGAFLNGETRGGSGTVQDYVCSSVSSHHCRIYSCDNIEAHYVM